MLLVNKLKKYLNDQRGFTLIEILIVMFITGLVLTSVFSVLNWNFKTAFGGVEKQKELESFRIFNSYLIEDLQFAKNITILNEPSRDTLQYVSIDNRVSILYFESDGLYKQIGTKKIKIAEGSKYEANVPAAYFENSGMIRINFYAKNIDSLLFVTVKPLIFKTS
ncbi:MULTISPECIES: PulJ/GspJ family protein [Bacillus cereus group]|uniref:PulJ/GspJ family protein n=1 Tax=Bacillus cereus group TaxID=86661 RepID=UPI0022E5FC33|nr:type II secretion system protein [Bacillus cereus group sp. TH152-1LC]MDA1674609.1 type II secretion system protein [Bacillus cereus group sp. TH152-1LC]